MVDSNPSSAFKTADLCDQFPEQVQVAVPLLRDYGGLTSFAGEVVTVKVLEDNVLVRREIEGDGRGRVLVVEGMGSLAYALVGDRLAGLAAQNGWRGIVVHGCIRDSAEIGKIPIGVKALGVCPRRSGKQGLGQTEVVVSFAGVTFRPGDHIYADEDGLLVTQKALG